MMHQHKGGEGKKSCFLSLNQMTRLLDQVSVADSTEPTWNVWADDMGALQNRNLYF